MSKIELPGYKLEIERKWMVNTDDVDFLEVSQALTHRVFMVQYYLVVDGDREVRIRLKGGTEADLTMKTGSGLVRKEAIIEISVADFEALAEMSDSFVTKYRSEIEIEDGLTIELDEYTGRYQGLVVAEIEFKNRERATNFEAPPSWFGKEVTEDEWMSNRALAERTGNCEVFKKDILGLTF